MKPRLLAIVDASYWAIGTTGKLIVRNFSDEFDFFFIPEPVLERRPDLLNELLAACDVVLCLNESGADILRQRATVPLPPVITWIHHVTEWNREHQSAAEISQIVLACTPGWKEAIAAYCVPGVRIEVVRNGIDPGHFYPRQPDRGKFGISPQSFVVGCFAHRGADRDAGRKGVDTLLAVLRKAAQEIPALSVVMAGPGWDDLAVELRATGAGAHILGFVPRSEVPLLYSLLDLYLLTSRVEGGPLPVLESMACGTPVAATRVGLVPDIVEDGVNGFSVEIGDVDGLVRAIRTLAENPDLHERMRIAARAAAEQHSAKNMHEPLRQFIRELVSRPLRRETHRGPEWLADPVGVSRLCCAAECFVRVAKDVRTGRSSLLRAFRMLRDMLEGVSIPDRVRALGIYPGQGLQDSGVPIAAFQRPLSRLVASYPFSLGKWRLRRLTSGWLVAPIDADVVVRVSGVVAAEWGFLDGVGKEESTIKWLKDFLKPGMTVVDVGANIGLVTLISARMAGDQGRVLSFEPTPAVAQRLRENVALNGLRNVTVVEAAVTRTSGPVRFFESSDDPEENTLFSGGDIPSLTVAGVTLDEALASQGIAQVDLLKIDAEGAEVDVLQGAVSLLSSPRPPTLIFEANPFALEVGGTSVGALLDLVTSYGYSCIELERVDWNGRIVINYAASIYPTEDRFRAPGA